ncbi:general secretion pathway protein GspB [Marinobacter hydrocarbonoclasticus]|nr:general secretion pathway protein GspB [Marinobacter nauticus]
MWALIPALLLLVLPAKAAQDPTRPPSWLSAPAAQSRPAGELQSILGDGSNRQAVIGGEIYREGDRLGGNRITEIRRDGVKLSNGEFLSLFPKFSERTQETRWD